VQNPSKYVRCEPRIPASRRDWALGNGLTYNDLEAAQHGSKRFGRNEGFHGALANRYGLLEKRWFQRHDQARIEVALIFVVAHAISIEYRARVRETETRAGAPPRLPIAA
jgi:hypothetical protein